MTPEAAALAEQHAPLARRVAARVPSPPAAWDTLCGEALEALCHAAEHWVASGQQGDPDGLFVVIVRRRCVDYLRREYGRHHGSPRRRIRRVQLPADVAEHQPSLTFETLVAGVAVDRRERELLLLLDAGWLLREIGARWGVTESAVCRMRRRIARRTDFEAVLR